MNYDDGTWRERLFDAIEWCDRARDMFLVLPLQFRLCHLVSSNSTAYHEPLSIALALEYCCSCLASEWSSGTCHGSKLYTHLIYSICPSTTPSTIKKDHFITNMMIDVAQAKPFDTKMMETSRFSSPDCMQLATRISLADSPREASLILRGHDHLKTTESGRIVATLL
jgi:hypothetical protein